MHLQGDYLPGKLGKSGNSNRVREILENLGKIRENSGDCKS